VAAGILGLLTIGDGFIYLVLQSRGSFAAQWFPLLYVATNVVFLAFAIPFGRIADRIGRGRMFVAGHVALLATYACAAIPVGGMLVTVACLILLGAFYAATDGVLAALAGQYSPPDNTASGIAAVQTVVAVARLVSSTAFGILWFSIGWLGALAIVGVALAIAIPAVVITLRPILQRAATT
jgi:MFS family permease